MNKFQKAIYLVAAGVLFTFCIIMPAQAISLEFSPVAQTVDLGDPASVDLVLKGPGSTLVGGYDFLVEWDASILSLDSIVFDPFLGLNDLFFPSDTSFTSDGPGFINAVELSFLTGSELALLQLGTDFNLFTLNFNTLSAGTSSLDLAENIINPDGFLTDDFGDLIDPLGIGSGSITVVDPGGGGGVPIPEPGTFVLLGSGLMLLALFKKKHPADKTSQQAKNI